MTDDKKKSGKVSDVYGGPKDRFYQFLENHEIARRLMRQKERRGALVMTLICVGTIALAVHTHENQTFGLVDKIFNP